MNSNELRQLFTSPKLHWIAERLRRRQERGQALLGTLTLSDASAEQRQALDALLGRRPTRGNDLTLNLRTLEETLGIDNPNAIVHACFGSVENLQAQRNSQKEAWDQILTEAKNKLQQDADGLAWIDSLSQGLLKRLSKGKADQGSNLMSTALKLWTRLPLNQISLAELAADLTGDTHALDRGQPLSALVLRGLRFRTSHDGNTSAEARRMAWEAVGVVIDRLSAPALTFNLFATPSTPLEDLLEKFREHKHPAYLTYQMLASDNPFLPLPSEMKEVFVVENPVVIDVAATTLGRSCAPLICTEGQPASTTKRLLQQISEAGARINLHADFDWRGLQFVDQLLSIPGTVPWQMAPPTYRAARGTVELADKPFRSAWSEPLATEMRSSGMAVYEEQILPQLLKDLDRTLHTSG